MDVDLSSEIDFINDTTFTLTTMDKKNKKIKISLNLNLVTGTDATSNPLGEARNDKNMDPYLGPPVGRLSMSLNPFNMLSQLMGPALWNRVKASLCLILCLVVCIGTLPMVVSNLETEVVLWLFGMKR